MSQLFTEALIEYSRKKNQKGTFPFLDDVIICDWDYQDRERNSERFVTAIKKYNLTLNADKCNYSTKCVEILGYLIENKVIKSDPVRLALLMKLTILNDMAALKRILSTFAHYCR